VTSRSDVDRLASGSSRVVVLAQRELEAFVRALGSSDPAFIRDALLQFMPELVDRFGDMAASVAADWYESTRFQAVGGSFNARLADPVDPLRVQESTRWAVGPLFEGDPDGMMARLSGSVQRYVMDTSRGTIARNVSIDPRKPRFARVPTGSKTCAWCSLLASRGFVYLSRDTAGAHDHFHDKCDCQIVSTWDDAEAIDGYNPDELYGQYQAARQKIIEDFGGRYSPKQEEIAAVMRRMFPESFTDGVFEG